MIIRVFKDMYLGSAWADELSVQKLLHDRRSRVINSGPLTFRIRYLKKLKIKHRPTAISFQRTNPMCLANLYYGLE